MYIYAVAINVSAIGVYTIHVPCIYNTIHVPILSYEKGTRLTLAKEWFVANCY